MALQQVRFHLPHRVQRHAYCDECARAAEEIRYFLRDTPHIHKYARQYGDDNKEQRSGKCQAGHYIVEKLRCRFSGPYAWDISAVSLKFVRYLQGLEHNRHPEIAECEYQTAPLAVDDEAPLLRWQLRSETEGKMQQAFRVLVAGSPEALEQGVGDCWDSGKLLSADPHVRYAGRKLASREQVWWKVMVWVPSPSPP